MTFDDITVVPYSDLIESQHGGHEHRGGPIWPDWSAPTPARYLRGGEARDIEPAATEASATIGGEVAWGGPITGHFGRQLADFSMRLVPTVSERPDLDVVFATHPRWGFVDDASLRPWFRDVLDWVGLPSARRRVVLEPTRVERLLVWPQAEQNLGPGPSPAHLDRMDAIVAQRLPGRRPRDGVVYVSRAGMHARFAGERAVEVAMANAGAGVIRPEDAPLERQLRTYAEAGVLVFAEGSAVHGCRLLGRGLGDIVVVERRPGSSIGEPSLRPRAASLTYADHLAGIVHGAMPSGRDFIATGIAVLDGDAFVEGLSARLPALTAAWDPRAFATARDEDVLAWIERTLAAPVTNGRRSRARILETLAASGLGRLERLARELLASVDPAPDDA